MTPTEAPAAPSPTRAAIDRASASVEATTVLLRLPVRGSLTDRIALLGRRIAAMEEAERRCLDALASVEATGEGQEARETLLAGLPYLRAQLSVDRGQRAFLTAGGRRR